MNNLKIILSVFFLACCLSFSYGQSRFGTSSTVPPSPTVGSLAKFVETPVAKHTGLPEVEINLHTIKLKEIAVPITLRYHLSGIKVDELSSPVGLGWQVDAGGAVIQNINGLNDFMATYGWLNTASKTGQSGLLKGQFEPGESPNENATWYQFNKGVIDGIIDSQPDLFYFSLPRKIGKVLF